MKLPRHRKLSSRLQLLLVAVFCVGCAGQTQLQLKEFPTTIYKEGNVEQISRPARSTPIEPGFDSSAPHPGLDAQWGPSSARIVDALDHQIAVTATTESSRMTASALSPPDAPPQTALPAMPVAYHQLVHALSEPPLEQPAYLESIPFVAAPPALAQIEHVRLTYTPPGSDTPQTVALQSNALNRLRTAGPVRITLAFAKELPGDLTDAAWHVHLKPLDLPSAGYVLTRDSAADTAKSRAFRSQQAIADGEYLLEVQGPFPSAQVGAAAAPAAFTARLANRTAQPQVVRADLSGLNALSPATAHLTFSTPVVATKEHFSLIRLDGSGNPTSNALPAASASTTGATVSLTFADRLNPGVYQLTIQPTGSAPVRDAFGNALLGNMGEKHVVTGYVTISDDPPSVRPGIPGPTGNYVAYPEFTEPRRNSSGFNPHDKVETRVARLYYYRDAHRVAQILNRKIRSHNRAGVDMQRQLADQARTVAGQLTDARQAVEAQAIRSAQLAREAESRLENSEVSLAAATRELARAATPDEKKQWEDHLRQLHRRVTDERSQVRAAREREFNDQQALRDAEAQEHRARERQFRLETAAAQADPDTYAEGVPTSFDPVEQVSISVIGEGLIQLRGPLKGINIVRTMIDQIDQPIGQVRVQVHTVQINGERADRMEEVAVAMQRQIDQARFLTLQSAELLRRAVVQVAAAKADEARAWAPGDTQADRDRRYVHAFFGKDFIDELAAMDSEFLHTGNKLLSLHSMDTTSLSSALNLMALAQNSTRREILDEFQRLLQCELPLAEQNYLHAGVLPGTTRRGPFAHKHAPAICYLADKAQFESLRAFFLADVAYDDTLTPLQREFIRLAQIFKARVITELEYKQRVTERAVIEEREYHDYHEQQTAFVALEREATVKRRDALNQLSESRTNALRQLMLFKAEVDRQVQEIKRHIQRVDAINSGDFSASSPIDNPSRKCMSFIDGFAQDYYDSHDTGKRSAFKVWAGNGKNKPEEFVWTDEVELVNREFTFHYVELDGSFGIVSTSIIPYQRVAEAYQLLASAIKDRKKFRLIDGDRLDNSVKQLNTAIQNSNRQNNGVAVVDNLAMLKSNVPIPLEYFARIQQALHILKSEHEHLVRGIDYVDLLLGHIRSSLTLIDAERAIPSALDAHEHWLKLYQFLEGSLTDDGLKKRFHELNRDVAPQFEALANTALALQAAEQNLARSRRPLDHKKFLDMLIDELEEKYIELMEGTRAHTANVDNYLKRLTTALDDDFNTQFYHPAFQHIRQTTIHRDVHFGQTETTTVLANNRGFAKVTPSATMEFDLPARDILILEALYGAKAGIDDFGALLNDPTFLALARGALGASTANPAAGSTDGLGVVRSVLPGLSSDVTEQVLAQQAAGRPQFGSNLENLIPDPAIYKFETGTGYEIRPVIQPDGQAVVFDFNYMYSTHVREPVRADEKHLGRVKRHFIRTDVQLSNFELREVSRYNVALKASRTARGVPLLEDIPMAGALFRPLPSDESSLQQNLILAQATIFPTLFDLMGLRWAPAVTDLDPLRMINNEFLVRGRRQMLQNRVYDFASERVDDFLRIPESNRRPDLYRSQETIPAVHPNGYYGPGLDLRDSPMIEGYAPPNAYQPEHFVPSGSPEGSPFRPRRDAAPFQEYPRGSAPYPPNEPRW